MKSEIELQPNCSESVFRFHVTKPEEMQQILQYIADEISANTGFEPHQNQKIPLLKSVKDYEKGILLKGCAGLGDNEAVIKIHPKKGFFTLNIGNNDISENTTDWVGKVKAMKIQVEEGECDKELSKIARDCQCGIVYGFGGSDENGFGGSDEKL